MSVYIVSFVDGFWTVATTLLVPVDHLLSLPFVNLNIGVPLGLHHPFGLIYDMMLGGGDGDEDILELILNLESFPTEQLINVNTPIAIFDHFMNMLKEVVSKALNHSVRIHISGGFH